jgi:membrane-associated progesterone receptor component
MGLRRFVASLFGDKEEPRAPLPEAEERDYSLLELADYDGTDVGRPLLIGIGGYVYDVTRGRDFYGPGGPYGMFAGKDCTRALAKVSFDDDLFTGDVEGLEPKDIEKLEEWIAMFEGKYRRIGRLLES